MWCFGRVFYRFMFFGIKNAKTNFLKKISTLIAVLQVITNLSSRLEKTTTIWIFAYYRFFFLIFQDFENHQLHMLKSFYVFYFM